MGCNCGQKSSGQKVAPPKRPLHRISSAPSTHVTEIRRVIKRPSR